MKKLVLGLFIGLALTIGTIILTAQIHYIMALEAVKKTEMSDSAIEHTMTIWGFDADAFGEITLIMKINALTNRR